MDKVLIIKFGEIAMRKNNKFIFIDRLVKAIRKNIDNIGNYYVIKEQGRLILEDKDGEMDFDKIIPKILPIFGIIGVCPGIRTKDKNIDNIKNLSLEYMKKYFNDKNYTFKVVTKRADKKYSFTSNEISSEIGEYIIENMNNMTVDVHNPQITLWIEIRNDVYLYSKYIKAFGGLPVGSSGRCVSLLSGGIDSPVASWLIAKRGVEVEGVYFHSPPYTSQWAKQKVMDLAERLSEFTGEFKLYVVPFTDIQIYLLDNVPHDKLTIFLKRAMMKAAQKIAYNDRALGLITGESVGQVASQTMEGINAINSATDMPVLRPLSGMDKQEIIDMAKFIGTYDISIRPYEDCCTIFVAKHPETRPSRKVIERIESHLENLENLINDAVENAEVIKY